MNYKEITADEYEILLKKMFLIKILKIPIN